MLSSSIDALALRSALALRDLSDPQGGRHAVSLVVDKVHAALQEHWRCPVAITRPPPVVTVADNYDRLLYPACAAARSGRYARYLDATRLLRTQMTSAVPPWLDEAAACGQDSAVLLPGLVWRRDSVDRRHVGEPHQLDAWRVSCTARLGRPDLLSMVGAVMQAVLPASRWRANETCHPYTSRGLEVEALVDGRWLEILECGEAAPELLSGSGLDPARWSGLAMGIGLDRMAMVLKGLDDIRLLRSADPRIARQMLDLAPYKAVSSHQSSTRDLSVAHRAGLDDEMLGDMLRQGLGEDAGLIEEAHITGRWPADRVPAPARLRLGLQADQENLLIRLVVRSPGGPLPKPVTAGIYRAAYALMHQGCAAGYLQASAGMPV